MVVIKLLTSPKCPMCPKAKDVVERLVKESDDVSVIELPVNTEEGFKTAMKFGIKFVPAIIINDEYVIVGVPTLDELREIVRKYKAKESQS